MGNTRKLRKKYKKPSHPWQKERIIEEKELLREYGLKNKREAWKMTTVLKRFKDLAKKYITLQTAQSEKESKQLMDKLKSIGLLDQTSMLNDILKLQDKDIMERRLQTVIFRNGLARSVKQARQFITHGHIAIDGVKISAPGYIVRKEEETKISFISNSTLADSEHPERAIVAKAAEKTASEKETRKDKKESKDPRPAKRSKQQEKKTEVKK